MLTYLLALAVGFGSLGLYATTFALPEVSRKNDLIWSGVGLFYALVLWVCAGRITGGVLLGQLASVSLMGWLGWQTMELRWNATPESDRVNASKVTGVRDRISKLATQVQDLSATVATANPQDADVKTTRGAALEEPPLTRADFGNPPKTKQQEAVKPTLTSFSNPTSNGNPLTGWVNTAKSALEGWTKPKSNELSRKEPKSKTVYVRKSFKNDVMETDAVSIMGTAVEPPIDDNAFDFGETIVTVTETVIELTIPESVTSTVKPNLRSVVDEDVAEAKVVEVMDEFGEAIDGLKPDL